MKTSLLVLVLALFFISCEVTHTPTNDSIEYGKMQSKGKKLVKVLKNNSLWKELKYDSLNRLSQLNIYHADSITHTEKYFYNANHQMIERHYGNLVDFFKYKNGLLTEKFSINNDNPGWQPKTVYFYKGRRISTADEYFNGNLVNRIDFDYDINANTILRKEYYYDGENEFLNTVYKCKYDNKKNPMRFIYFYPIDMVQKNNVIYSYHYNIIMSSLPPEYNAVFTYDEDGFPVNEKRIYLTQGQENREVEFEFIYAQ